MVHNNPITVNMTFAITGPNDDPIETPSICLYSWSFREMIAYMYPILTFLTIFSLTWCLITSHCTYTLFIIILIVLDKGQFVNRDETSKDTNLDPSASRCGVIARILLAASNESLRVWL